MVVNDLNPSGPASPHLKQIRHWIIDSNTVLPPHDTAQTLESVTQIRVSRRHAASIRRNPAARRTMRASSGKRGTGSLSNKRSVWRSPE